MQNALLGVLLLGEWCLCGIGECGGGDVVECQGVCEKGGVHDNKTKQITTVTRNKT